MQSYHRSMIRYPRRHGQEQLRANRINLDHRETLCFWLNNLEVSLCSKSQRYLISGVILRVRNNLLPTLLTVCIDSRIVIGLLPWDSHHELIHRIRINDWSGDYLITSGHQCLMVSPKKEGVFWRESPVTGQISFFDDLMHKNWKVFWLQDVLWDFSHRDFSHRDFVTAG